MHAIGLAAVRHRMRTAQIQIPALAFAQDHQFAAQPEFDVRIRRHRHVQPRLAKLRAEIVVGVRLDD